MAPLSEWLSGFTFSRLFFIYLALATFLVMAVWEFFTLHKRVAPSVRIRSYRTNLINLVFNNLIMLLLSVEFFYALASYGSLNLLSKLGGGLGFTLNSFMVLSLQFIILDFLIYIWHLLNHKIDFLWNFHKAHHCDQDLNTSTGIRFHVGELLLSLLYKGIIVLTLGIPPEMMIAFEFITVYAALFHHSNVRVPGESVLRFIFIMPSHHATHHSVPRRHHDSNYGVVFSLWDYALRTRNPHQPQRFGLIQTPEMSFPQLLGFSLTRPYLILVLGLLGGLLVLRWVGG